MLSKEHSTASPGRQAAAGLVLALLALPVAANTVRDEMLQRDAGALIVRLDGVAERVAAELHATPRYAMAAPTARAVYAQPTSSDARAVAESTLFDPSASGGLGAFQVNAATLRGLDESASRPRRVVPFEVEAGDSDGDGNDDRRHRHPPAVPLPGAGALLLGGLACVTALRRGRRAKRT